jgi:ribokinase
MAHDSPTGPAPRRPRVAVVGHIEWVDFVSLARYPEEGQVAHATQWSARVGGGGGVAATVLADMGAEVDFFLSLGRDANGHAAAEQLAQRGVTAHVAWRETMTRRAITYLTHGGERTIVTIGDRLQPRGEDDLDWARLDSADGVYFTAGDPLALAHARRARVLTASPRGREALAPDDGPQLDALIYSEEDDDERAWAQRLDGRARLMVATEGAHGGRWSGAQSGRWSTVPLADEAHDAYGAGDSFAAAFTFGLARGDSVAEAARLGAERGAHALTCVGAP